MMRTVRRRRLLSLILVCTLSFGIGLGSRQTAAEGRARPAGYTVHYDNGTTRTYRAYRQYKNARTGRYDKWGAKVGCVLTAVAIAASGFDVNYTPQQIHRADRSAPYGERYALQELNMRYHPHQAYTLCLANQILNDMGIESRYVPCYRKDAAEQEILEHLDSGRPVIILVKRRLWNRISLTDWRHALVLVKHNHDGTVTFLNPSNMANCSSVGIKTRGIHLTVRQLLDHFMFSSYGRYSKAYNPQKCGGYILVGSKADTAGTEK